MGDWRAAIDSYIDRQVDRWTSMRRHLHVHPEPSREEFRTTDSSREQLEDAGLNVRIAPSGRGLVAEPDGQGDRSRSALARGYRRAPDR